MKLQNTQGERYYGLHFYPGVAEYHDPGSDPYRVYLNEDTLRKMDPTFAVKPIFVEHVDGVTPNLDELRKEADGWVVKSFFNEADGKHWVEFIVTSELGKRAIQSGMRLSNAYFIKSSKQGGLWNGVSYVKEITDAEYEHLAIVANPRYEESIILTPDEFKKYNEENVLELKKIANSKGAAMKFTFFKKSKVENAIDSDLSVVLPKSGKEVSLSQIINAMDEKEMDKNAGLADMSHKVKMHDGSYCNVGELVEKHKAMCDEMESMKKSMNEEKEDVKEKDADSESDKPKNEEEKHPEKEMKDDMDNSEDEEAKKKALQLAEHEDKEIKEAKEKNKNSMAKIKAERLRTANTKFENSEPAPTVDLSCDKVQRGRNRYGS